MAVYKDQGSYVDWTEQHLYGSSRLGIWNYGKKTPDAPGAVVYDSMMVGSVNYELSNHLGNVLSTISDKKIGVSAGRTTVDYYSAVVTTQNDYYPFGMQMPGRGGSLTAGGWVNGTGGASLLADLTVSSRTGNEPREYKASKSIEFIAGFTSGVNDEFTAYIDESAPSGGGGTGGEGSSLYRYGFNGKEMDNETYGQGNEYDYGFRIYNPRIGRFLSVDPLTSTYPWYTPYQFAGNKPIWAIDLDGLEEKTSTSKGLTFFPIITPAKARTPGQMMSQQVNKSAQAFSESRTGKFIGGACNFTTGTIGTIASISYIGASDGAGAAVVGVVALQFSLGEMSIGTAQMMDAIFSKKTNDALQNSGSIPGLIAYGPGSKNAPFIDALGQFTPTLSTAGSIKGLVKSGLGVIDAAKTFDNTSTIANTIALLDQISDTKGFVLESFNLASNASGGKLKQTLSYAFSYTVQKGDNLTSIADKFHTNVETIAKDNGIKDINKINEGQSLKFSGYANGSSGGAGSSDNY